MAQRNSSAKPRSRSVLDNDLPGRRLPTPSPTSTNATSILPATAPSPSGRPSSSPASAAATASLQGLRPSPFSAVPDLPLTTTITSSVGPATGRSSRITRASARQAAGQASIPPATSGSANRAAPLEAPASKSHRSVRHANATSVPPLANANPTSSAPRPSRRKRKASEADDKGPVHQSLPAQPSSASRRSKRPKVAEASPSLSPAALALPPAASTRSRKGKGAATMSSPGSTAGQGHSQDDAAPTTRKSSRNKKTAKDMPSSVRSSSSGPSRRSKRTSHNNQDTDTTMTGTDDAEPEPMHPHSLQEDDDDDDDHEERDFPDHHDDEDSDDHDEDDLGHYAEDGLADDPFGGGFMGPPHGSGLPAALSMLGGMLSMSGMGTRLRDILNSLQQKDDPSVQLIALQGLSEILLVSNEDNLSGTFSTDAYVRELVTLMQPNELTGEENPEVMLLACRCLANLMEALPASAANVVYGGAVPVLCQKLLEISFIDLAEQALSTLEKISVEYPASIVREGGLTACLSYLEFFATSTQRTAVTTAANCCRNIPEDSFPVVRDVMPILLNVLSSNDQRVVEQASLCVSRIVESFRHYPSKLEELVGVEMLKAILRLLLPGSTNHLIGPSLHTQFLRVLAITANASPRLATELFKMNIVETLYQILTGVSPPSGTEDIASKLDSVLIMQALIHRPREQIIETLNVICNLLPREAGIMPIDSAANALGVEAAGPSSSMTILRKRSTSNEKRIELLSECKDEVRHFALILFPTLTDAYSSTVNLDVRSKVLSAQIKMLSNFDHDIILDALRTVAYASFLASILSQQDHPILVKYALQATELLMSRLGDVYRYQLYREGVIAEIEKISAPAVLDPEPLQQGPEDEAVRPGSSGNDDSATGQQPNAPIGNHGDQESISEDEYIEGHNNIGSGRVYGDDAGDGEAEVEEQDDEDDDDHGESRHLSDEDDDDNDDNDDDQQDDMLGSPVSSEDSTMSTDSPPRRFMSDSPSQTEISVLAKLFLQHHETEKNGKEMRQEATKILSSLCALSEEISGFYLSRSPSSPALENGTELFKKLATFFDSDVFDSVTSAELLASGVVHILELVFNNSDDALANAAQSAFLEAFMGQTVKSQPNTATADSTVTPFSIMIRKLQDLLSRSEHFEVITVHHNTFDGNRSSAASMLAKQIRLRLVADDNSDIPRAFRSIMVSIHAIATFKALEDYLRPRISLSDRPRVMKRDGLSRALAAMAGSGSGPLSGAPSRLVDRGPGFFGAGPLIPQHASTSGGSSTSRQLQPTTQSSLPSSLSLRSSHKPSKLKSAGQSSGEEAPSTPEPSSAPREKTRLRRSSRRAPNTQSERPQAPAPEGDNSLADALECADEKQVSDDDADVSDNNAMDGVVDDIDEDMDGEATPDTSAVNLEVAVGGKITARKEDGTRVPTPLQGSPSVASGSRVSALTAALQGVPASSPAVQPTPAPPRPTSYAAAIQSIPQDWHMEFTLNGKAVPMDSTVYRAILSSISDQEEHLGRSVWSAIHSVHYRRVPGPKPAEPVGFSPSFESSAAATVPGTTADAASSQSPLDKNPTTASILRLLKILHDLNANVDDVLVANKDVLRLNAEPLSQFVNTKLTAKLNRQLEEPLIVASNCIPNWSEDLARLYPFLFPFETRHLFLQSTSFGYARSMARWQNSQVQDESRRDRRDDRPFLGRLQRQKVRISRSKILESAVKVMELYGASQSILEVEYFEEVGTGLGPTLEFYSTVSREFCKKKLKLWRENELNESEFVSSANGLFPRPLSDEEATGPNGERIMSLFRALGKFVARSMLDSRIIDINLNPIFFRIGEETSGVKTSLGAVKVVDPTLARSLLLIKKFAMAKKEIDEDPGRTAAQKVDEIQRITINNTQIEDLSLDFTLPGHPEIELISGGAQIGVTIDNVDVYIENVIGMTLGVGVRRQVDAFRKGFSQVFPYSALSAFTPDELVSLFGRVEEDWSLETLMDSIKADHGFNMDSHSVKNLLQVMSEMAPTERREFLQFTTGSPKLPIGGFRSLTPMFTVVCKPSEAPYTSDEYLPSVMTCVNYLKLPDYSSIDILRRQLFVAIKEGQGAFHLS